MMVGQTLLEHPLGQLTGNSLWKMLFTLWQLALTVAAPNAKEIN
jgi:hypothetical protein